MINLLPPEVKEDYRYARRNRHLLKWVIAFLFGISGIVLITASGVFIMHNASSDYRSKIATAQTELASQNDAGIKKEVTSVSNNLKLMVTVLSKEILFSKLLAQLGTITPQNVVLTDLSISQTESAIDITAQAANYNAAAQLQANLADKNNQIFSSADIVNITCASGSTATTNTAYPCTVNIRALFAKNNPFLFINANSQKSGS